MWFIMLATGYIASPLRSDAEACERGTIATPFTATWPRARITAPAVTPAIRLLEFCGERWLSNELLLPDQQLNVRHASRMVGSAVRNGARPQ